MREEAATPDAVITCDPASLDLAQAEFMQVSSGAKVLAHLDEGVLLVALSNSYWELAEMWQDHPPIFVQHICPVQHTVPLPVGENAIYLLQGLAVDEYAPLMEPGLDFSVQTRIFADVAYRPYDVNTALAQALEAASEATLNVRTPQQILSLEIVEYEGRLAGLLGLSPARYNLSDWAGGKRRFKREANQISRAEFKLLEALEVFDVHLPPRGVVLDLGAAPGGWSRVLRQKEQFVTAVDPAQLDPQMEGDPAVRHKRMTAEQYLSSRPDRFDLIVNDMRLDARDSARLMVEYAPYLYRHGRAIMTLKLPQENRQAIIEHAFNILRQAYDIVNARQLFHNRSEITVSLKLKGRQAPPN